MESLDHSNTFVFLIGASHFPSDPEINDIPNVLANIKCLREILLDQSLIGIQEGNIVLSINEGKREIIKKLKNVADITRSKKFTLIVYYTGHGILSSEDYKLYLATAETSIIDLEIDGV